MIVVDGCATLWTVNWPIYGMLLPWQPMIMLDRCTVMYRFLIFDRYMDHIITERTRDRRASVAADHRHHLVLQSPISPRSVSFTVIGSKVLLIYVMCYNLPAHFQEHLCSNKLIIADANTIPYEISMGVHIKRHDTPNSHEEAYVIIVKQVLSSARQG